MEQGHHTVKPPKRVPVEPGLFRLDYDEGDLRRAYQMTRVELEAFLAKLPPSLARRIRKRYEGADEDETK